MRKLVAILMASTTIAACSGSSSSDSNPIPIDQIPAELAKSYCAAEQACAPFFYEIAFTNTDCIASVTKEFQEASFNDIQAAVTAGTVKYDGDLARTCANAISAGSCSVLDNNTPDSCQKALSGATATGGDCDIDAECTGLARCDVSGGACPGKCAPRASAGVACGKDGDCALGFVCSPVTSKCVTPAASDEPCGGTVAGNCAAGLICTGNNDDKKTPGTCKAAASVLSKNAGDDCDLQQGTWCADTLSCVAESITGTTLNSKCHTIGAAGASCGFGIPGNCPKGQYCPLQVADLLAGTFTANCADLPTEGATCGPKAGLVRCAANLVCDDTTAPLKPVCISPHELGQTCSDNSLCYSAHCVGGACVPASPCAK